ncbi:hypothetical protein DPEC_G00185040 [Dallia pectoralis]|uniref:Uncharacterized protein n=1 Tax=Dallia pectoralis TaxID=75939 RepID=A0ACC2GBH3_DALPE|nr:hypothetical protein DPEC_G00185040 [Dallia pectoralis]
MNSQSTEFHFGMVPTNQAPPKYICLCPCLQWVPAFQTPPQCHSLSRLGKGRTEPLGEERVAAGVRCGWEVRWSVSGTDGLGSDFCGGPQNLLQQGKKTGDLRGEPETERCRGHLTLPYPSLENKSPGLCFLYDGKCVKHW